MRSICQMERTFEGYDCGFNESVKKSRLVGLTSEFSMSFGCIENCDSLHTANDCLNLSCTLVDEYATKQQNRRHKVQIVSKRQLQRLSSRSQFSQPTTAVSELNLLHFQMRYSGPELGTSQLKRCYSVTAEACLSCRKVLLRT